MAAPLMRDTKIAANQVAIELAAVAFSLGIMAKEIEDRRRMSFIEKPFQLLHAPM